MRQEILRRIPFGTPIKQARPEMESSGFTCQDDPLHRVLVCDRTVPAGPAEIRSIRVWFPYDAVGTVKEVQVRYNSAPHPPNLQSLLPNP
jgi:hypothetical protein